MTLLARLPEELLCQIVRYLLPDDVDNFSSSHEEFHAVASRILPRHNELKERYSLISCRYETGTHPIILLRDILQDPEIIWYVKTIDLELSDETTLEMSEEEVNEAQKVAADCESDIFKTVKACPCLDDGEHDWINDILSCYWTPVLILLVCSLTCLENIWIRDSWTNEKLHRLVREFAQTKYLDPASPHAFSKVNHVEEGSTHSEYFTPMESFEPFSRLPTMRRYTGRYLYQQDSWTCPEEKSTITVLELYECIVHIGALRSALRSIANLEEFTYECYWFKDGPPSKTSDYEIIQWSNTYANNWERDWQVGEIILSLLEFARHSLVELDLTRNSSEEEQSAKEALEHAQLCRDDRCGVYKDVKPHRYESDSTVKLFIGSLRGFQVLKYIRAQNEMFVEEDSVNAAGGGKVHRLVDLLPASVKMIALAKPRLSWEDSYQLLEGLPELKAIVVPKLELIEFEIDKHNRTIPNSHVRLRFQAVGVELIL